MASEFAKGCYAEGWMGAAAGVALPPQYLNPPLPSSTAHQQMMQAQALAKAQHWSQQNALANQQNLGLGSLANQQAYQNALTYAQAQAQQWPPVSSGTITPPVTVVASMSPLAEIGRMKIRKLVDQLPLKVICRIHLIELHDMGNHTFKFVVTYTDFRTQDFCNVDEFPSPADVSLVLLGTP
jgi:hypothetical protein